jgi:hypothetical protein
MQPIRPITDPLEGLSFALTDLHEARAWAAGHPELRLVVATGHRVAPEVIQIYSPGGLSPRWCLWRDFTGAIRGDDRDACKFGLRYPTVKAALRFVVAAAASPSNPESPQSDIRGASLMRPTQFHCEGLPFALDDLRHAVVWGMSRMDFRVDLALHYPHVPEVIEVRAGRADMPGWCIWRDDTGQIFVDDWESEKFALPYRTLTDALAFIGCRMRGGPPGGDRRRPRPD